METIFDLPVIAFRNIPESIVAKLHDVTSQATGYAAVTTTGNNNNNNNNQSSSSPLAILDGTKIVSRIHLGSAVRKALMNALPNNNNNNNTVANNTNTNINILSATQLIENSSRAVSPRRLASPNRKNKSPTKSAATESKDEKDVSKKPNNNKQRIASQIVFALNTSKTNAVKNFALSTSSTSSASTGASASTGDSSTTSQEQQQQQQHPCVVIIFDVEISPAEAWRWVRSSGASGYVISLDNLQSTVDSQAVCGIYSLDPRTELSSSLSMSSSLGGGGSKASNSNFPNKVATRDISWLERQIVSKIATAGV